MLRCSPSAPWSTRMLGLLPPRGPRPLRRCFALTLQAFAEAAASPGVPLRLLRGAGLGPPCRRQPPLALRRLSCHHRRAARSCCCWRTSRAPPLSPRLPRLPGLSPSSPLIASSPSSLRCVPQATAPRRLRERLLSSPLAPWHAPLPRRCPAPTTKTRWLRSSLLAKALSSRLLHPLLPSGPATGGRRWPA